MFKNKRIIAIVMTLLMVISMLPGMAFAAGEQNLVDYNVATRSKILTKNGTDPVDKDTNEVVEIWRIGAYGDSTKENYSNFKQYLFHGADVETENNGIPNVENPYANQYGFNYTILTDINETGFWDNYIQEKLDSTEIISFGMFFSGTASGHLSNDTVKDFVLNKNILQIVELDENGNIVDTPLTGDDFYSGHNGASYTFVAQNGKIEPNVSGVGSERSNDVLIQIAANALKPGTDYQLVFKSGMGETDVAVLNKKVVFNFTTADSTETEEGITLNRKILTLETNETAQLTATLGGETLTETDVTWKSSNTDVAKVSKTGKVTAVAKGEAEITVETKTTDKKTATCKVTVVEPAQQIPADSIVIKESVITMAVGDTRALPEVEITPANSTDTVKWTSSDTNESILNIRPAKKTMEALTPGTVTLTATTFTATTSSGKTATCTVTVEAASTPDYEITSGANSEWTENSDGTLTITGNGDFDKFDAVKVDDKVIDADNYVAAPGSTIITLKADYLKTLSVGSHKFEIVWKDGGSASTNFTVKAAEVDPGDGDNTGGNNQGPTAPGDNGQNNGSGTNTGNTADKAAADKSSQTGDDMNMTLYVLIMLAALAGAVCVVFYRRQRQ